MADSSQRGSNTIMAIHATLPPRRRLVCVDCEFAGLQIGGSVRRKGIAFKDPLCNRVDQPIGVVTASQHIVITVGEDRLVGVEEVRPVEPITSSVSSEVVYPLLISS